MRQSFSSPPKERLRRSFWARRKGRGVVASLMAAALVAGCADGAAPLSSGEAVPTVAPPAAFSFQMASVAGPKASSRLFQAQTFTLANGLEVVVVENHRVPVVSQMVWYKVGAADEPRGKSGLAHLLEHLMFKGTAKLPPSAFSSTIARHGGVDNAFTNSDVTAYYENIAVEHLPLVMEMEADRMRNLRLDTKNVLTERDVVYEERLSRTDNEPAALLEEQVDQVLWQSHPYRNPVIGWPEELKALTREDALAFYRRWYAPNNAVVVISGDVSLDQVKTLAETIYGPLKPTPRLSQARHRPPVPTLSKDQRVELHHPRVAQSQWQRVFLAPSYRTATDPRQVYALQVLDEILTGGPSSRLEQALVRQRRAVAHVGSSYHARSVDAGTFSISFVPNAGDDPNQAIATAEALVQVELDRLLRDGVTAAEVEKAKTTLRAGVIFARDSLQGAAQTLGQALATGGTLDQVEDWPQHIAEVTPEQVMAAARSVLSAASVTSLLLPETRPVAPSEVGGPR